MLITNNKKWGSNSLKIWNLYFQLDLILVLKSKGPCIYCTLIIRWHVFAQLGTVMPPSKKKGSEVGAVVRALTFHLYVLGLIPGLSIINGLSLLLVFLQVLWFSPLLKNQYLIWFEWFQFWFTVSQIIRETSTAPVLNEKDLRLQ